MKSLKQINDTLEQSAKIAKSHHERSLAKAENAKKSALALSDDFKKLREKDGTSKSALRSLGMKVNSAHQAAQKRSVRAARSGEHAQLTRAKADRWSK
jgi:hypothetical protein